MISLLLILHLGPAAGPAVATSCPALEAAVESLGGLASLRHRPPLLVAGRGEEFRTAEIQGPSPGRRVAAPHEERLAVDPSRGVAAYYLRTGRHDGTIRERSMRPPGGTAQGARQFGRRIPHLLLLEMSEQPVLVRCLADTVVAGQTQRRVMFAPPGEERQLEVWFAGPRADLVRIRYPLELPGLGETTVEFQYAGWGPHPVLFRMPASHQTVIDGEVLLQVQYTVVDTGVAAVSAMLPAAVVPTLPAPPTAFPVRWETVSEGTHLVTIGPGLTAMVVELGHELVVVEAPAEHPLLIGIPSSDAPGANALADTLLGRIADRLPGRPIRALVLTHLHSDHAGGVRPFVAAGIPVIGPQGSASFVGGIARAPLTRRPDSLTRRFQAPRLTEVADSLVLRGGGRELQLHEVGPNPHTDAMLMAYLPDARLVFQGDLFYPAAGQAAIVAGREPISRFFAAWLVRRGLEVERVFGVHGGVGMGEHLEAARRP